MNLDSFQQLFPLVLLVIWVVFKALQQKKARRPSSATPPMHREAPKEDRRGRDRDQQWSRGSQPETRPQPVKRGDLYDSMRKAMEEYFGEPPAPAHMDEVVEPKTVGKAEAAAETAPATPRRPAEPVERSEEHPGWATELEPELTSITEEAPAVAPARATVLPTAAAAAAYAQAATLQYALSISGDGPLVDLESIDLRKAVAWSEILAAPVALRE